MMEITEYLLLFRRWAWLLILGLALGTIGAYFYSRSQVPVYQASTKILVLRGPQALPVQNETVVDLSSINDRELLQTYMQLLTTRPVLDLASEQLGFRVSSEQIHPQQVGDTSIIRLMVQDSQPQRAAVIANTLADILIDQNEKLQASRYADSEESLQTQLDQIQSQIDSVQKEIVSIQESKFSGAISLENLQAQVSQLQKRFDYLDSTNQAIKSEVASLQSQLDQIDNGSKTNLDVGTIKTIPQEEIDSLRAELQRLALILDLPDQTAGSNLSSDDPRLVRLEESLRIYQQMYSEALGNYENVRLARTRNTPSVVQVEDAEPPRRPIQPQPVQFTLMGAMSGLIIAGGIAFLFEYLDDTLHLPDEVTRELGLPVLGIISKHDNHDQPVTISEPRSPASEAFRSLRTNLQYADVNHPISTLLLTSPSPKEGKTTIAVNLAVSIAQFGHNVLLLDADLRRPQVHKFLSIKNRSGVSDLFMQEAPSLNGHLQSTKLPQLHALTSGALPPNPAELLGSPKMTQILNKMSERFDITLIDCPPVLVVTDAAVLGPQVDGVLMVVKLGETKIAVARQAVEQLRRVGANVLGVVLNDVGVSKSRYYKFYYKDYYSNYYGHSETNKANYQSGKMSRFNKKSRNKT